MVAVRMKNDIIHCDIIHYDIIHCDIIHYDIIHVFIVIQNSCAYSVSLASFPLGSIDTSGSRFGIIFKPWLKTINIDTITCCFFENEQPRSHLNDVIVLKKF